MSNNKSSVGSIGSNNLGFSPIAEVECWDSIFSNRWGGGRVCFYKNEKNCLPIFIKLCYNR